MPVVVVESPAKAKTINKYLGPDYTVLASYGHVRDLPPKDGSVDTENGFDMKWEVASDSKKHIKAIADALKEDPALILATDPDREGEAISWHLEETLRNRKALKKDTPVSRVVFNAITKAAVTEAMQNPRDVDRDLVEAYLARRALDYLVGFNLSPVLWRKLPGSRSAGRVQSVSLRIIVEREMEIEAFNAKEYWTVKAALQTPRGQSFEARLTVLGGNKLDKVDTFMTSTLQQEASRKFGFGARQTMQVAQRLYEAGHITYMRTDGIDMAPEAVTAARDAIKDRYGDEYVPGTPRIYKNKAKNAQLYDLIWKRTLASQMEGAKLERTTVDISSADAQVELRATGQVVTFDGFMRVYEEGRDDVVDDDDKVLPQIMQGEAAKKEGITPEQHFTQPPPRFTEATLVKKMEEIGIGRPSTYASIVTTIQDRGYVRKEKNRLFPEDKGRLVTVFLVEYFRRYVGYDFTAKLEGELDDITSGDRDWQDVLTRFWRDFKAAVEDTAELRITDVLNKINEVLEPHLFPPTEDGGNPRLCPNCGNGQLSMRTARSGGAFIGCSNYPECRYTRAFGPPGTEPESGIPPEGKLLGEDAGDQIWVHKGRFGPYVQRGLVTEDVKKPPRQGVPEGWEPAEISLAQAVKLLELPRLIGQHPEDGVNIWANIGRYGPYLKHAESTSFKGGTNANLESIDEVWEVGMNRAVQLIDEKKASRGRGRQAKTLRDLGEHPDRGGAVAIMDGKYGPYVKWEKVNATLPDNSEPDKVTMELAVQLIEEREAKSGKKKTTRKKKAS